MTLKEWFKESKENLQAIYDARNGKRYAYTRGQKLSKFAQNLVVEQVGEIKGGMGAWVY